MITLLLIIIYIAFISLGLPDALLGAGWPVMQSDLNVPFGYAGFAQMLISGGTIVSSMFSGPLLRRFGTGKLTVLSVSLTAAALFGFSASPSILWIFLAAVPLGLGAGAVDAGLNAYVATHYESRHMNWLHSFWGVGALGGPLVLSLLLSRGMSWRSGYGNIAIFQVVLLLVLIAAIPLWDKAESRGDLEQEAGEKPLTLFASLKLKGVVPALIVFLFYCAIEATMGLWGGSFLFKTKGMAPAAAALWVSAFYGSITAGRFLTGFLTTRFSNDSLIRSGAFAILGGILLMLLPLPLAMNLTGFILVGLGCAPIFPSMLHETPVRFGKANAPSIMGFQMAVAYIGSTFLPPLFGFIAGSERMGLFPWFLLGYIGALLLFFKKLTNRNQS